METYEVHSKSFAIKWLNVPDNSVVKWQVKPLKKSIRFCIYKQQQSKQQPVGSSTTISIQSSNNSSNSGALNKRKLSLEENMANSNLVLLYDFGKLPGNELQQNEFLVKDHEGGAYAFVFDNTFSISNGKKVLFTQFIEPSSSLETGDENAQIFKDEEIPEINHNEYFYHPVYNSNIVDSSSVDNQTSTANPAPSENTNINSGLTTPTSLNMEIKPRSLAPPLNGNDNRNRSSSVYTLSNLLSENTISPDHKDFPLLAKLNEIQTFNLSGSGYSSPTKSNPPANGTASNPTAVNNNNTALADMNLEPPHSKFRKKSSHSLSRRNRSNSTTSIKTNKSLPNGSPILNGNHSNDQGTPGHNPIYSNGLNRSNTSVSTTDSKLFKNVITSKNGQYIEGILLKKKRKKNSKSFSKRFFSLNFKQGVIEYRLNQTSPKRGSMHVKLVEITANRKTKEINIDSGVEIWHLKALTETDWEIWVSALDIIRLRANYDNNYGILRSGQFNSATQPALPREYDGNNELMNKLSSLEIKLSSTKKSAANALNDLKEIQKTTPDTPKLSSFTPPSTLKQLNRKQSSSSVNSNDSKESRSFFRRPSTTSANYNSKNKSNNSIEDTLDNNKIQSSINEMKNVEERLSEIETIINQMIEIQKSEIEKNKKNPKPDNKRPGISRNLSSSSLAETVLSEDFFDAHEYIESINSTDGVILIDGTDDFDDDVEEDDGTALRMKNSRKYQKNVLGQLINKSSENSQKPEHAEESDVATITTKKIVEEEYGEDDLYPLNEIKDQPIVKRRTTVKDCTTTPPSLLQFFRKNVGKDMSSIAMPVTSNEPLTLLQKFAEMFEYTDLIDKALLKDDPTEKLLYISAFAISYLSSLRSKERNIRKPFMPLLGETYELVRDDLNYRLLLEKVSHKPLIFCFHIDNENWEINSTIMPVNKFWGKSLEIINKGSFKLKVKKTGEIFEWNQPTTLLRNLIAGEKYIEPIDSITINCSTGEKSIAEFKPGGMFSGKSEEVVIKAFDENDNLSKSCLSGLWKEKLNLIPINQINNKVSSLSDSTIIWKANPLLPNSSKKWGFTKFAAELNEVTIIEKNKLPPTDSRLRPDLKNYENGQVEVAEELKLQLEQLQRDRRNEGKVHEPKFFIKGDKDMSPDGILLNWSFVKGEKSYWNLRKNGDWEDLLKLYDNTSY